MSKVARGTFSVSTNRSPPYDKSDGVMLARASLDKKFEGDLVAVSEAQMLSASTPVQGSAAYVAIERVFGKLHGKVGAFVLQHCGTMARGNAELTVAVVPDSGSGDLQGIAGKMKIDVVDGKHLYTFEYDLPA